MASLLYPCKGVVATPPTTLSPTVDLRAAQFLRQTVMSSQLAFVGSERPSAPPHDAAMSPACPPGIVRGGRGLRRRLAQVGSPSAREESAAGRAESPGCR